MVVYDLRCTGAGRAFLGVAFVFLERVMPLLFDTFIKGVVQHSRAHDTRCMLVLGEIISSVSATWATEQSSSI